MSVFGRLLPLIVLSMIFIAGCGTASTGISGDNRQSQSQDSSQKMAQLIIKFRNSDFDPSQNNFVQELSNDARTTIIYLRPMSGGAHVFRLMNITDDAQLSKVIERLSRRPDILYVEQDRIMRHDKIQ